MGIINCDSNCKYQVDGYCTLDSVVKVNNSDVNHGCAYFVEKSKSKNSTKSDTK